MLAAEAEYYDAAMTGPDEPAMLPLHESPWRPVYEEAVRWIPSSSPVIDLGCGTGRFFASVVLTSHYATLVGIDFSKAAVAEAASYVRGHFEDEMAFRHRCRFVVGDLREWTPPAKLEHGTVFTCLEVLEHLDDDLDLVARIPPGSQFVFSVPSYMSESHVRCFPRLRDVFERYSPLLSLCRWRLVDFGCGNVVHVLDSTRRQGVW